MTRDQTSYGGDGAVRGTGHLAGSGPAVDHAGDRESLFSDVRRWEAERRRELDLDDGHAGHPKGKRPVLPEEAAPMYRAYLTTDKSQQKIGREHGWSDKTVSQIVNRKGRFADMEALDRVEQEVGA